MSWAEDEGLDGYDIPDWYYNEGNWKQGFHVDSNGKHYNVSEMTDKHLKNTIKYFFHYDTTPLVDELARRNRL